MKKKGEKERHFCDYNFDNTTYVYNCTVTLLRLCYIQPISFSVKQQNVWYNQWMNSFINSNILNIQTYEINAIW